MAKKANENLAFASYWDNHYIGSNDSEPTHEWFKSYSRLTNFFNDHLFSTKPPPHPTVLHLGSGDSTVPIEFHNIGYKKQTCIDFSKVVSDKMAQLHADKEIHWVVGDVRDMKQHVPDASVDVAFDKGTLDAMISGSPWDPPDFVLENTKRYIDEVRTCWRPRLVDVLKHLEARCDIAYRSDTGTE